ncbi:hypothetical protein EB796_004592 [Bugula neritina]|uniref:Uncharacterized protein n=1 Tax=Bugula neritina TaxID=10212 RepID=A0A7J7KHZ9_BUGNE|nr:hypothetical protein EB796_004592 [Bugula neritina]
MSSTSHKVSRLPVGEVKPLKKSNSLTALILSPDSQNEASADKQETEESSSHSNILFTSSASMDELATIGNHNMERKTNKTTDNEATVKARLTTLPRPITLLTYPRRIHGFQGLDNSKNFCSIDKPLSKRPSADCKKRTGTPLQELDRKWALEQCEVCKET